MKESGGSLKIEPSTKISNLLFINLDEPNKFSKIIFDAYMLVYY
jgi:hypothetical protein